ncbi:MAG: hypothetical protein Q4A55_00520 [Aerococcus sp.]|nr:hypothetical protein [Aerococcus sp.]
MEITELEDAYNTIHDYNTILQLCSHAINTPKRSPKEMAIDEALMIVMDYLENSANLIAKAME